MDDPRRRAFSSRRAVYGDQLNDGVIDHGKAVLLFLPDENSHWSTIELFSTIAFDHATRGQTKLVLSHFNETARKKIIILSRLAG